jgi:hypothetical protein
MNLFLLLVVVVKLSLSTLAEISTVTISRLPRVPEEMTPPDTGHR